MTLKRFLCIAGACALLAHAASAQLPDRPDETATIGTLAPDVRLIADDGTAFSLRSLAGHPVIISPVFTRCPHICKMITSSLRDAARVIDGLGKTYHVVTLSFDPADTADDLRAYRETLDLPDEWILATSSPEQVDTLLSAFDFRYVALDEGGFAHTNAIIFLDGDQRISGYLHGTEYAEDDVRRALTSAWVGDSLVSRYRRWIILVAVIGLVATVLAIVLTGQRGRAQPA